MRSSRKILSIILLLLPFVATAQLRMPTFDVALKSGVNTSFFDKYGVVDVRLEGNVHVNQFLAAGVYYSRSIWGIADDIVQDETTSARQQMYGIRVQGSTGRISKFRPYAFLTYSKMEIVQEASPQVNFAGDWNGITFGGGLMIRLRSRAYLNIPEIEYYPAGGEFFFLDSDKNFIAIRLGANIIIGKNR